MSKSLNNRRDFLKNFLVFLSNLSTNIRYNSADIFTIVSMSANTSSLGFLAAEYDYGSVSFDVIWNDKINSIPKQYSLTKTDRELLLKFGRELGKTDVEGQLRHIELFDSQFKKQLKDSEEAIKSKSKLYKTMGFFVGTAAALMMI